MSLKSKYEKNRSEWITSYGSNRLQRAVARGYKYDGIYLDERMAVEVPGFIRSIGKSKVGEAINPTAEALDLEERIIQGGGSGTVRLVRLRVGWVPDRNLPDGEYVQITGYLGRHAIYRSVAGWDGTRDEIGRARSEVLTALETLRSTKEREQNLRAALADLVATVDYVDDGRVVLTVPLAVENAKKALGL